MVKISALPPIAALAADDETPAVDDSASSTGKFTVQQILDWLQTQTDWVDSSMIDYADGVAWEVLGRTTLGSNDNTISVQNLAARTYLKVIFQAVATGGTILAALNFNNDTANNYAQRTQFNGTDASAASAGNAGTGAGLFSQPLFYIADILNISSQEKMIAYQLALRGSTGNNVPSSGYGTAKWINTASQISRIDAINAGAGNFAAGSEIIVLGRN